MSARKNRVRICADFDALYGIHRTIDPRPLPALRMNGRALTREEVDRVVKRIRRSPEIRAALAKVDKALRAMRVPRDVATRKPVAR